MNKNTILNLESINSKLELHFQPQEVNTKVSRKNNCLQILLEAENTPEKEKCILEIEQILRDLQLNEIDSIKVYGRKKTEDFPEWINELTISNKTTIDITELAQKRNLESIIALLSNDLDENSINVKANWKNDCLQIILVSEQEFSQEFASIIKEKIFDLDIENCEKVKIYSQQIDNDFPDWSQEFSKEKSQSSEIISQSPTNSSTTSKLVLAKQGDPDAIAYSLNYLLKDREIIAKVVIKKDWLQITLEGNKTPERESLINFITNFVQKLELTSINNLQIHAWRKGATFKSWSETISLVKADKSALSVWDSVAQTANSMGENIGNNLYYAGKSAMDTVAWAGNTVSSVALQATDGVGYLFEVVTNSPQLKELTKTLKVDWLIKVIEQVDVVKAETEVRELQAQYPNEKPAEIAHRIIVTKAMYAGGSGLASSLLPGFAAAMFTVDLAANMLLQAEMVYQIACAYGLNIQDSARKGEVLAIFGLSLGGSQVLKTGSQYALKAGLGFLRNIPAAGAAIGASTNALMLYSLGYGACRFYEAKATPITMEATLEDIQLESENYLKNALEQEVIIDQILVHVVIASSPKKSWQEILPELKTLNLSPASLERIAQNMQFPPSLEDLLAQLNEDFATALLAQCQKIANLDGVITPEEAKIMAKIARKINID